MSFQLCEKCKGLWTYFGTGSKPDVCPKCQKDEQAKPMKTSQLIGIYSPTGN